MENQEQFKGVESHVEGASGDATCRVCVVTNEIAGASRNGGIGTAYTSLVQVLAAAEHRVTVLLIAEQEHSAKDEAILVEHYAQQNIQLIVLYPDSSAPPERAHIVASLAAYHWLRDAQTFHVIHFPECRGYAYHSTQAKQCGLAFANTTLCIGTHSSTEWIFHANEAPLEAYDTLSGAFMERASVALADVVLSPSAYLVKWMIDSGWELPKTVLVQPYVMSELAMEPAVGGTITELVFFGRLETRKGLELFCDAVSKLVGEGSEIKKVSFLGREGRAGEFAALEYIERVTSEWNVPVETKTDLNQEDALAYLTGASRLAVMASPVDNSPNTVYECLALKIPFIAANTGGIPELIHSDDLSRVTFAPKNSDALADSLRAAIGQEIPPIRASIGAEDNRNAVSAWHARLAEIKHPAQSPAADPNDYTLLVKDGAVLSRGAEEKLRAAAAHSGADIITGLTEGVTPSVLGDAALSLIDEDPTPCQAALIRTTIAPAELSEDSFHKLTHEGHRHLLVPERTVIGAAPATPRTTYEELHDQAERIRPLLPLHAQKLPMLAGALARQASWLRSEVAGLRSHLTERESNWKNDRGELKEQVKKLEKEIKNLKKEAAEFTKKPKRKGFFGSRKSNRGGDNG